MAMPDTNRPDDPLGPDEDDPFELSDPVEARGDAIIDGPDAGSGQLALGDEDVSLPWLEGDDDFEEHRGSGGQFLLLAAMALGALALAGGGVWWFSQQGDRSTRIADGSVIEAPAAPYKEKPADPGGMTFEGTGDTSYAVSEGETRQVRLGSDEQVPAPGFDTVGAATGKAPVPATRPATGASPAAEPSQPAVPTGPGVQVGAYSSRSSAEAAWTRLVGTHEALSGVKYRVVEARADIGTVYRLQALPGDAAAARALCGKLKASGQDCAIKN